MSWKNRLENKKFTIQTGDGKVYEPLWKNGSKGKEYNFSRFEFINVKGSLIDKKEAQSNSYPLTFWFNGDDNIEKSDDFEKSCDNPNPWTINHPFYGTLKGQPVSLNRNDNSYGVTEITVTFWESISDDYPEDRNSIVDNVSERSSLVNQLAASSYISKSSPKSSDIPNVKSSIKIASARFDADSENFNEYKQLIDKSVQNVDSLVADTSLAISSAQRVLDFPAKFKRSIRDKISSIKSAYEQIKLILNQDNKQSKHYFESQASTLLTTFAQSAVNPIDDDYVVRSDVENVNSEFLDLYNDYLLTLDNSQVNINDIDNAYSPDTALQQSLINLVTYTSQALFDLGFSAKQERIFIVDRDTNLIVLTHKFLGLDPDDRNIEIFKRINVIRLNEIFKIKKGRLIKYYQ